MTIEHKGRIVTGIKDVTPRRAIWSILRGSQDTVTSIFLVPEKDDLAKDHVVLEIAGRAKILFASEINNDPTCQKLGITWQP